MTYDAFISYSHSADGKLAPTLQRALKSLAKPWYRLRALSVFRDETDLSAVSDLTAAIRGALAGSRYFIYLASPSAARSRWVGEEIETWKRRNLPERLLIAVTEGEIEWNSATADFDWRKSNALHPNLKGVFTREPLWVDLSWAKSGRTLSPRDPRFQHATAMLAAPMHGKTLEELIGEDVRLHRRTRWLIGTVMATLALLLALFIGATVIATRVNSSLQSKLSLIDQVLPFFRFESNDEGGDQSQVPAWRQFWGGLLENLLSPEKAETWVEWGPTRLALRSDCMNSRKEEVGGQFDCPGSAADYDRDDLRSDIPGLAPMVSTLTQAIRNGRTLELLNSSRVRVNQSADDDDTEARGQEDLELLVSHADIVLPDRLRVNLPIGLRSEARADHFESRRGFGVWRQPLRKAPANSELILIQLMDSAFCGSAGCSNPTVGFLRVESQYALVFAQSIWGSTALYDAGPGNMPQIFSIGIRQAGSGQQYRTIARSIFDLECLCYLPYLTGQVESVERGVDQRVPPSLIGSAKQTRSAPDRLSSTLSAQGPVPGASTASESTTTARVVRIEDIEGSYELRTSAASPSDRRWEYDTGRLEIRKLGSDRVLILLACGWRGQSTSSCWDWRVFQWRDGQLFGIHDATAELWKGIGFEPQTRSITLRSASYGSERLDTFAPASASDAIDAALSRRLRAAANSWSGTAKGLDDPQTLYSNRIELTLARPIPLQRE